MSRVRAGVLVLLIARAVGAQQISEPALKGDLVFEGPDSSFTCRLVTVLTFGSNPCHVAMFIGNDQVTQATANEPHAVHTVGLAPMQSVDYKGARTTDERLTPVQRETMVAYLATLAASHTYYDHAHNGQKGDYAASCGAGIASCWNGWDYFNEFDCVGLTERAYELTGVKKYEGATPNTNHLEDCRWEGSGWKGESYMFPQDQFESCYVMHPRSELLNNTPVTATVHAGTWRFFEFTFPVDLSSFTVSTASGSDVDLYVRGARFDPIADDDDDRLPTLAEAEHDCQSAGGSGSETCTLTEATAKSPWGSRWYVGVYGKSAGTSTFTITLSRTNRLTASRFTAGSATGTITSSPAGINCGATCAASFSDGTPVHLTATPAAGSMFAGWDNLSGCPNRASPVCDLVMNGRQSVTAYFDAVCGHVLDTNITPEFSGHVSESGGTDCPTGGGYTPGSGVRLTASPNSGYVFSHWTATGGGAFSSTTSNPTIFTITGNALVTAHFAPDPTRIKTEGAINGGFESAPSTGNIAPGWTIESASGRPMIQKGMPYSLHGTAHAAFTPIEEYGDEVLRQTIIVPPSATVQISFWANVVTKKPVLNSFDDRLSVEARGAHLFAPRSIGALTDGDAVKSRNQDGVYFQVGPVSVPAPYEGGPIELVFTARSDDSLLPTVFRVDDVSVEITTEDRAPATQVTAPANGATVSGTVNVTATASDDVAVSSLEIVIDGVTRASVANATSLAYAWDTTTAANGSHAIEARARDGSGHSILSALKTVTVANTFVLPAPAHLVAVTASGTQVNLAWGAVAGAARYQVFRKANGGAFALVATPVATSFQNTSLTTNTTYVYQVKAVNAAGAAGAPSNVDLATTIVFTDDPVVARLSTIKAVHITQLRTAVNAVRATAGLPPATVTNPSLAGVAPKLIHILELRTALNAAKAALGVAETAFTGTNLTPGVTTVKANHIQELRASVK